MEVRIKALEKDNEQLKSLTTDTRVTVLETQLKVVLIIRTKFIDFLEWTGAYGRIYGRIKTTEAETRDQGIYPADARATTLEYWSFFKTGPTARKVFETAECVRYYIICLWYQIFSWREKTFQLMMQAALAKKTEKLEEQRYQTWVSSSM